MIAAPVVALAWQVIAGLVAALLVLGGLAVWGWKQYAGSQRQSGQDEQRRVQAEAATADQEEAHANLTHQRQRGLAAYLDRLAARRKRRKRLRD
jgi:hypothetical protein